MAYIEIPMNGCVTTNYPPLDIYKPCPAPTVKIGWAKPAKQEDKIPMASYAQATVINPASLESDQRSHVRARLRDLKYDHVTALKKQFGLVDDDAPRTPAELIERITSGNYTIDEEHLDYKSWGAGGAAEYIRWRNPNVIEDKAGFKAAEKKLDDAYQSAKDAAILSPVADLQKVIDDFKSFTA